jgi:hypothetical protein
MKHHFIYMFRHPSVHPSGHPFVLSWFVYSDRARKSGIQMWHGKENNRKRWHTCQSPAMTRQMDEVMLHICSIIHLSYHGLVIPTGRKMSEIHIYIYSELKINNIFSKCHQLEIK